LTQAKQVGFRGKFLSADGFTQDEINTAGNAADGVYFTNIYADNVNDLIQQYKTRYHTDPASAVFVSLGYDGVNVLIEASKIAEEKNIPLRDALTMVKIQGTGALIDMNGKQYADRIEKIYQVIKGTSQLAE
jgi:ABC-type branched-subunit amino acid transport system substrate-binding protein